MIQVRLITVRKGVRVYVGGRVMADELDCGKVMVIKVLLRATSFSDPLLTQKCHQCIYLEKKGIRCQQILKQQNMSYNHF